MESSTSSGFVARGNNFNGGAQAEELSALADAWTAIIVKCQRSRRQTRVGVSSSRFWSIVHAEYAKNPATNGNISTPEELQRQWSAMIPGVAVLLEKFVKVWENLRPHCLNDDICRRQSLESAKAEHAAEYSLNPQHCDVAEQLVNHREWWNILWPQIKQLAAATPLPMELPEQQQQPPQPSEEEHHFEPNEPVESSPLLTSEAGGGELPDRRVKRRLNSEDPHVVALCTDDALQHSDESPSVGSHCPSCLCRAELKKAIVMERQWELEIMTRSTVGLELEAVEYLRLQRRQILMKLQKQQSEVS